MTLHNRNRKEIVLSNLFLAVNRRAQLIKIVSMACWPGAMNMEDPLYNDPLNGRVTIEEVSNDVMQGQPTALMKCSNFVSDNSVTKIISIDF
jgi:hypothetical protein